MFEPVRGGSSAGSCPRRRKLCFTVQTACRLRHSRTKWPFSASCTVFYGTNCVSRRSGVMLFWLFLTPLVRNGHLRDNFYKIMFLRRFVMLHHSRTKCSVLLRMCNTLAWNRWFNLLPARGWGGVGGVGEGVGLLYYIHNHVLTYT